MTMDELMRISLLVLGGFALALLAIWYIRFCYQEISGTGLIVIDPLTVVTEDGKGNTEVGHALAQMLQSRLDEIPEDIINAKKDLEAEPAKVSLGGVSRDLLPPQNLAPRMSLPLDLFPLTTHKTKLEVYEEIDMKVSVGGVDVGGILPWLQRKMSSRRTLHFSVYSHGNETQVSGSISGLGISGAGLRLVVPGEGDKPPGLHLVADQLAYEIIRRKLVAKAQAANASPGGSNANAGIGFLSAAQFQQLAEAIEAAAKANLQSAQGQLPNKDEKGRTPFDIPLTPLQSIADSMWGWPELDYFTGWTADKAQNPTIALKYYRRAVSNQKWAAGQSELAKEVQSRVDILSSLALVEDANKRRHLTVSTSKILTGTALDDSFAVRFIHDQGSEASAVGQAIAACLEIRLNMAEGGDNRVSARYIYYAARQATRSTGTDSGAKIGDALTALSERGAVEEKVWPYIPGQFSAVPPESVDKAPRFRIEGARAIVVNDEIKEIQSALKTGGPLVAGIPMYESAMSSPEFGTTGIIPMPKKDDSLVGGHAVAIVGYDDEKRLFKFVNSWGASWGDHGFGYLPYDYLKDKNLSEFWTFRLAQ